MKRRISTPILAGLLFCRALAAAPLEVKEVSLEIGRAPSTAAIHSEVRIEPAEAGSVFLAVSLTNTSGRDLAIENMALEFPWSGSAANGDLLCAGGASMGDQKPRLQSPGNPALDSGSYLMYRQDGSYSLAGFVTWKTFWSRLSLSGGHLRMTAEGEHRRLRPGETVALEKIWLADGTDWQDLMYAYAGVIARVNQVSLRLAQKRVGWSTWDYYGRKYSEADVATNLDQLLKIWPQANLLQIDGGWWGWRGDFFARKDLPGGMKRVADLIKTRGLTAGIHLDGMRADLNSEVAKRHPDYFLKDQRGTILSDGPHLMSDGDRLTEVFFDFSNPGAVEYMRQSLARIRHDWGFDYIKIDFLRWGIKRNILQLFHRADPTRDIVPFDPGLTSVERTHLALAAFRAGMGDDAYFLACTAPFGLVIGHADALRTGDDVSPQFQQFKRLAVEDGGNFYLHGKVIYNDADYVVVRGPHDQDRALEKSPSKHSSLTVNEAEMWAHYVALFGGPKIDSDNLALLPRERAALFQLAATLPTCDRYLPLDFWQHLRGIADPPAVFLGEARGVVYLALFNWTDRAKEFQLTNNPAENQFALTSVAGIGTLVGKSGKFMVRLPARHSTIFRLEPGADFDHLRKTLHVE
jgi:hypothetical protein